MSGCVQPPEPQPYNDPGREPSSTRDSAVTQLQKEASAASRDGNYALAIETLQRAIRIEPRNAYSWHYLGLTYQEMGDPERCASMAQRSNGFAGLDDRLAEANDRLINQCGGD